MLSSSDQASVVTLGPWAGRDGFIADTAVKIDKIQSSLSNLGEDAERTKSMMMGLKQDLDQHKRLQVFEETLRNGRDYKIEEMQRCARDIKQRLANMEGDRALFSTLPYSSFQSVSAKLQELSLLQSELKASERRVRIMSWLFGAACAVLVGTLLDRAF